jgi:hypothetical protein
MKIHSVGLVLYLCLSHFLHVYTCRENPGGDASLDETTLKLEGRIEIKEILMR